MLSTQELLSLDVTALQSRLDAGSLSSTELVKACLAQMSRHEQRGAKLNAMLSIVPEHILSKRASALDDERKAGRTRSLFHGIPVIVKDACATGRHLEVPTTVGSLALKDSIRNGSARIIDQLEEMGAIILGKTNLNEFCNFKGDANSNGWSALGGQTQSAYIARKEGEVAFGQSDPCGSSTGSAVGVSAGYAPLALGTELVGSIVMPGMRAGLYAFKPAIGSVNLDGIFRITAEHDVVGGFAKSPTELALLSEVALNAEQRRLLPPGGYLGSLSKKFDSLRIGYLDPVKWALHPDVVRLDDHVVKDMNEMYYGAIRRIHDSMADKSAIHPVHLRPTKDLWYKGRDPISTIIAYDGERTMTNWLSTAGNAEVQNLEQLIAFNEKNHQQELPPDHPDQNQLLAALQESPPKQIYEAVVAHLRDVAKTHGIDKLFEERNITILVFPMDSSMPLMSAASGYPIATSPVGVLKTDGRPYGLGILAQTGHENLMFQFMSAFETHFPPRVLPGRLTDSEFFPAL